jgi:arylsulfatase A-like enzyme
MNRFLLAIIPALAAPAAASAADRPNVLIVITDDQGFGDLGCHGNPVVRTPNLDAFARESVWLKNFYVSPVCSPTRSSLLTGFYNYRTGIVDTYLGRSMMRPDVKTLPELLAAAGYRTGLFGKWHLGDNHPLRPEDRGFHETLWHQGGGLAQPADPPGLDPKSAYFNPVLKRNGKEVKTKGYCTDVFTDAAIAFVTKGDPAKPFFACVSYNAPHSPYQVPDELPAKYRKLDLTPAGFPNVGQPWAAKKLNTEEIARAYGMIENIDANFGRLLKALGDKGLAENTLVVFLTDNGPGGVRFNAGLRNRKGTVYEGGIRVPCYVRWPGRTKAGAVEDIPLAHIDITPTVLEACGVKAPGGLDGRSFLPKLTAPAGRWADRTLFFQWHRGDAPEKYRAFAARGPQYKLVQAAGVQQGVEWQPRYELFDIPNDPFETKDLAAELPDEVARLKREYEAWFDDVTKNGFDPPRIVIGSEKENPVRLSRQDWRGPKAGWAPGDEGHWEVAFARAGQYRVTLISRAEFTEYGFEVPGGGQTGALAKPARAYSFEIGFAAAESRVGGWVKQGETRRGVDYIELEHLGPPGKK